MTADIRTAAQAEAEARTLHEEARSYRYLFVEGAVWAQARVTPTREQISKVLYLQRVSDNAASTVPEIAKLCDEAADEILALLERGTHGDR